jgi:hypothetical protein
MTADQPTPNEPPKILATEGVIGLQPLLVRLDYWSSVADGELEHRARDGIVHNSGPIK